MSIGLLQKITATTIGAAASVAIAGAIDWNQPAQAFGLSYTYTSTLTASDPGTGLTLGTGVFTYLKEKLAAPGQYGYEVLDAAVTIGALSYTLDEFLDSPTIQAQVSSFLSPLLGPVLPTPYASLVANVLDQDPNVFDYIGDGSFPPNDFNHLFTYGSNSVQVAFTSTFVTNGSSPTSEAVPEPTTMLGLGLAGAGLAAARRRRKQQA